MCKPAEVLRKYLSNGVLLQKYYHDTFAVYQLTHWGRVTHICDSKLTITASDNSLSPDRHQAIIWTNAGILLIVPLWTNFGELLIEIPIFSFKKVRFKVSSAKRRRFLSRPQCVKGVYQVSHGSSWISTNQAVRKQPRCARRLHKNINKDFCLLLHWKSHWVHIQKLCWNIH